MEPFSFTVVRGDRLDQALVDSGRGISRRGAKRLLDAGRIAVEGKVVKVASRYVPAGSRVSLLDDEVALPVLFETRDFIAVDKPIGIVSQPSRDPRKASAIEIVSAQLRRRNEDATLHVIHRLDAGVSGVLLFARNREAAAMLSRKLQDREIEKIYLALVRGNIPELVELDQEIDLKEALTVAAPVASSATHTFLAVRILTGRFHQIRQHLAAAGTPIAGDSQYGEPEGSRLMLHAHRIGHPAIGRIVSPLPPSFLDALKAEGFSPPEENEIEKAILAIADRRATKEPDGNVSRNDDPLRAP